MSKRGVVVLGFEFLGSGFGIRVFLGGLGVGAMARVGGKKVEKSTCNCGESAI